ncbi:MAG: mechanosensitive ion channel protein MscS [Bacteroidetes bacterium]|nr:MAG: mechanosensitive ion channel protein MscS [Bacteroidota bacterium]
MENWFELVRNKLSTWMVGLIKLLPNFVLAVLAFILFYFGAKLVKKFIYQLLLKLSDKESTSGLFSSIAFVIVIVIGLFVSFDLLHLEKAVSSLLAGAGIIGLALGFAFQDLTANFISGIFIIFRKPFDIGHIVDTNGFVGTVEEIQLRSTTIRSFQGLHVMVPNRDIFQKPITNYTLSGDRRIDITLTLPAQTDANQLEGKIKETLGKIPEIANPEKVEAYYTDYNGDTLNLEIWCWVDNRVPKEFTKLRDKIIRQVHTAVIALNLPTPASSKS